MLLQLATLVLIQPAMAGNPSHQRDELATQLARAESLLAGGQGASPEALAAARQAAAAAGPQGSESEAVAAGLLGRILMDRGDLREACAAFERALDLSRSAIDATRHVESLHDLIDARLRLGEGGAASALLDEAESLAAARTPSVQARQLELRSRLERNEGRYEKAMAYTATAHSLRASAPQEPKALVDNFNLLGELEWFQGRFDESRSWHRRAVETAIADLGDAHPATGLSLSNLALAELELGNLEEARGLLLRALSIARAARGESHPEAMDCLHNLANLHLDAGEYPQALMLYQRVQRLTEQRSGADSDEAAHVLHNLGLLQLRMGRPERARETLSRTLRIWERLRGLEHPFVARALDLQADATESAGDLTQAARLVERAVAIRERMEAASATDRAWGLVRLGWLRLRLGRRTDARSLALRAAALCETHLADPGPDLASTLLLLGELEAAVGRDGPSLIHFEAGYAARRRAFGPEHTLAAEARARRAAALRRDGQYALAFDEATAAEQTHRSYLRQTLRYLAEPQALGLAARQPVARNTLLSVLEAGKATPRQIATAFEAMVAVRSLVLDEMAARRAAPSADDSELDGARRRLALLLYRESSQPKEGRIEALQEARQQVEALEGRLAAAAAERRTRDTDTAVGLQALRGAMPAGTALVSFVRYREPLTVSEERYLAFVLRPEWEKPLAMGLGPTSVIDSDVGRWRALLKASRGGRAQEERRIGQLGATIRRKLWDPIEPWTAGTSLVLIVPDGPLSLLSFGALPARAGGFLVEHGPVLHYLATERDLLRQPRPTEGRALLALGGPDYDARPAAPDSSVAEMRGPATPCGRPLRFAFLPHAASEVVDLGDLWRHASAERASRVLVGREASETAFRTAAPASGVLHLATHGFFAGEDCGSTGEAGVWRDNPLLQTGLALAGANSRSQAGATEADDGLLTAAEVARLDLRSVSLAVLSACGSGLGRLQDGEGVLGLRRAFALAGVGTVVMSLWNVDDVQARLWMRSFYQGLLQDRLPVSDAVRRAQLDALARLRREKGAAPPGLWGAFVAAGDWR